MAVAGRGHGDRVWLATAALALAFISVAFLIANLGFFEIGGEEAPVGPISRDVSQVLFYVLAAVWLFVGVLVMVNLSKRGKGVERGPRPKGGTLSGLVAMLVIISMVLLFVYLTDGQLFQNSATPGGGGGGGDGGTAPPMPPGGPAGPFPQVGLLIFVALLAVFLGLRYVRGRPVRASLAIEALERERAGAIVEEARTELYAGEDPRSAVVRAYQRMARLMGGEARGSRSSTPRELADAARSRLGWPEGPTLDLTALFEEAWYSDHRMGEESRERALRCLEEIALKAGGGAKDVRP